MVRYPKLTKFYLLPVFLLLMAAWSPAGYAQITRLKVAYPTTVGSMGVLWVTKDAGLFEKHGLDVTLIYVGAARKSCRPCWPRTFLSLRSRFPL